MEGYYLIYVHNSFYPAKVTYGETYDIYAYVTLDNKFTGFILPDHLKDFLSSGILKPSKLIEALYAD